MTPTPHRRAQPPAEKNEERTEQPTGLDVTAATDKQGSTWLRWILAEAAQTAKRSPQFAATYQAIARRRGKKIATTAVARKLLTRAYHLLADTPADAAAGETTTKNSTCVTRAPRARSQTGRVTKPRARSLTRHEPTTPRQTRASD